MKKYSFVLTAVLFALLSHPAFAQPSAKASDGGGHVEGISKEEIASYQSKGFSVYVGDVAFDAGPSHLSVPGTNVCTDGTFLRAGTVKICETSEDTYEATDAASCTGKLTTYELKAPIHYQYLESTPDGAGPSPSCPNQDCMVNATAYPAVPVLIGTNFGGGGAAEGGSPSDVANTVYTFPSCAK